MQLDKEHFWLGSSEKFSVRTTRKVTEILQNVHWNCNLCANMLQHCLKAFQMQMNIASSCRSFHLLALSSSKSNLTASLLFFLLWQINCMLRLDLNFSDFWNPQRLPVTWEVKENLGNISRKANTASVWFSSVSIKQNINIMYCYCYVKVSIKQTINIT